MLQQSITKLPRLSDQSIAASVELQLIEAEDDRLNKRVQEKQGKPNDKRKGKQQPAEELPLPVAYFKNPSSGQVDPLPSGRDSQTPVPPHSEPPQILNYS